MKNSITLGLAALFLVAAGGGVAGASDLPEPGAAEGTRDPVFIESTDILYMESYPIQVALVVRGSVPTPCHEIDSSVQVLDDGIDVQLWSVADPDQACIQVLEPFEVSIPLGEYESASLPVFLDGDEIGRIEIGSTPTGADFSLVGAGWSYGMCLGYCLADLEINDDNVLATGRSRLGEQPLYRNAGTVTPLGREQLDTAIGDLAGTPLDAVYGCPDCADGGTAYLKLSDGVATSRVEMQADQPPDLLADTYRIATSLIDTLATCASSDLVVVDADCAPYHAP